jgi:hypothetical protein
VTREGLRLLKEPHVDGPKSIAAIKGRLKTRMTTLETPRPLSILELRGLGKEQWQSVDAVEHVQRERATWGRCPTSDATCSEFRLRQR